MEESREGPPPRGARLWVAAGLAALVVFALREFLAGGVFYRRDVHLLFHPQAEAFVRAVAQGAWPLWDPSPGFGQPFLANPDAQVLYPFAWLNLILRPWTYYTVFVAAHALFSGWGMALLARRHGLSPLACFAAGALWIGSGPFVSLFDLWHHYAGACWMPWVALAGERAFSSRRARDVVLFGAAAGMQLLAGSADMAVLTSVFLAAHLAVLHVGWRRLGSRENLRLLGAGAAAVAVAVGLSAGLWLTAAAASRGSARWGLPEGIRTYWSVHPAGMVDTLIPGLAGVPLSDRWRTALFESREPFLPTLYLGLGTWTLGLGAVVPARGASRRAAVLAAIAAAGMLVALGRHAPFYSLLVAVVPPLRALRYPVKVMVLVALASSLAAGHGLDRWRRAAPGGGPHWAVAAALGLVAASALAGAAALGLSPASIAGRFLKPSPLDPATLLAPLRWQLLVSGALASALAALTLAWRRGGRAAAHAGALVAGLAVADLALHHRVPNLTAPVALYTYRPEVVDLVRQSGAAPRVYAYDYSVREPEGSSRSPPPLASVPTGWSPAQAAALAQQMTLTPGTAGRWGIDSSWDMDYRGLYPYTLGQLALVIRKAEGTPLLPRLLRMGGVTHVIAVHQEGLEGLVPQATFPGLLAGPIRVFTVPGTLPRTYAIASVHQASGFEAMKRVLAPDFDPAREVILPEGAGPSFPPTDGPVGTTRLSLRRADRVRVEADMQAAGYLVLLDGFSDGWRATVDGRPAPILPANLVFRAVALPPGKHVVDMVYRPPAALVGLTLSGLTAVACVIALARLRA